MSPKHHFFGGELLEILVFLQSLFSFVEILCCLAFLGPLEFFWSLFFFWGGGGYMGVSKNRGGAPKMDGIFI